MSDEENENTGGWDQAIIAFIKKIPLNLTRIAKGAVKGAITEMKEDTMKEDTMKENTMKENIIERSIETHIKCDVSLKSWQENNVKAIYHKSEKYRVKDGREKEVKNLNPELGASIIDKGKNISDEEMQEIWAKTLAGELDTPGTFSKKTLSVLNDMSQRDAKLFTSFCQFVWLDCDMVPTPLIYDPRYSIHFQEDIRPLTLQHLESMGLISISLTPSARLGRYYENSNPTDWHYYGTTVTIQPKKDQQGWDHIITGMVSLTQAGKELFLTIDTSKNEKFLKIIMNKWREEGYNPVIKDPEAK